MCKLPNSLKEASILQPKSWDDYVSFAGWLIYKRLLVALLILISVLLAVVLVLRLWPKPEPEPEPPVMSVYRYYDELLKLHSGEAIITNESDKFIAPSEKQAPLRTGARVCCPLTARQYMR